MNLEPLVTPPVGMAASKKIESMTAPEIVILASCAAVGWLMMGFSLAQTALLLLASGAVLGFVWLAFVLCLA